jgi:hypothetical protein
MPWRSPGQDDGGPLTVEVTGRPVQVPRPGQAREGHEPRVCLSRVVSRVTRSLRSDNYLLWEIDVPFRKKSVATMHCSWHFFCLYNVM